MISQYDIGTVVMLNSLKEEKEVYFTYVKCEIPIFNIFKGSSGIMRREFFTYDLSSPEWDMLAILQFIT